MKNEKQAEPTKKLITLHVRSREGLMFEGSVSSLSSVNDQGRFDILENHANFISVIYDKISYRDAVSNVSHEIPIHRAILQAVGNEVKIYVGM